MRQLQLSQPSASFWLTSPNPSYPLDEKASILWWATYITSAKCFFLTSLTQSELPFYTRCKAQVWAIWTLSMKLGKSLMMSSKNCIESSLYNTKVIKYSSFLAGPPCLGLSFWLGGVREYILYPPLGKLSLYSLYTHSTYCVYAAHPILHLSSLYHLSS